MIVQGVWSKDKAVLAFLLITNTSMAIRTSIKPLKAKLVVQMLVLGLMYTFTTTYHHVPLLSPPRKACLPSDPEGHAVCPEDEVQMDDEDGDEPQRYQTAPL